MSLPEPGRLHAAMAATWPPETTLDVGPFRLRRAAGGGQRVTAATAIPGRDDLADALPRAEAQMQAWGQPPLFRILPDTPGLDALLEAEGYGIKDPTILYAARLDALLSVATPRLSTFAHWPPLAIQRDIWTEGGVDEARMAVMCRAPGPRVSLLARHNDAPAGTGFAALQDGIVMVHALEVRPEHRRQGVGARMMGRAAQWGADHGATHVALAVTEDNIGARELYTGLGMRPATRYHYRVRP